MGRRALTSEEKADNGDQSNPATLDLVDEQPPPITHRGSRSLGIANRPASTIHEPVTVASETDLRPEVSAGPQVPTRPIDKQTCPDSNHVAAPCSAATNRSSAAGQDEGEEISAIGIPNSDSSSSNDEQPGLRPGRPRLDPDISPRGRTRLRVQRHRDRQHLARVQQIVHQAAVTQELPPTVEFSALTLRDDSTPSSSPPAQIPPWSGPELEFEEVSLPLSSTASPVYVEGSHGDDAESSSPDANAVLLPTVSAPSSSPGLPRQDDGQSSSRPRSSTSSISDSPDCFIPSASPSLGPENHHHHPILGDYYYYCTQS